MVNPLNPKKETSEKKISFTDADIINWIKEKRSITTNSVCVMFVGHPKTGKTGCALDCRTDEEIKSNKKIIAIELNSDQGCEINRNKHHNNDQNIIILNPREYSYDEKGEWQPDYIKTMAKIKSLLQYLKNNIDDVAAIVFDGLDIFLTEICESQMRIDEHIDITGGVSLRYWQKRNEYYYKILNMLLDINTNKYLITHFTSRRRDDKTGAYDDDRLVSKVDDKFVHACQKNTPDKVHQIVEFHDNTKIVDGKPVIELVATIVSDRTNLITHMKKVVIAKNEEDKIIWNGKALLR